MKKLLLAILVLVLAAGTVPLSAANANFQCNATFSGGFIPMVCDASRTPSFGGPTSCSPSTISLYFWDFDTRTSSDDLFTTSGFVSHSYTSGYCDVVNLAVFCADSSSATRTHCICTYIGVNGCIRPGAGWTP